MTRTTLVTLLLLCALALAPALAAAGTRESAEDKEEPPPKEFPEEKAVSFDAHRMPKQKPPLEAIDMQNAAGPNETERVDHPNVHDPGTMLAEGTEEGGRGSIRACTLPSLSESNSNSSASDWLADSGNVAKVCHLPMQWLHNASGTVRVCSLPYDAWINNITITDDTIPKELLAQLNTTGAKCVTPSKALSGNGSTGADDSFANGNIISAWLRDKDTIYIYFIPKQWLRASPPPMTAPAPTPAGAASEVEDLTRETLDGAAPTPEPSATTGVPAVATATATDNADATATAKSNATAPVNASANAANSTNTTTTAAGANASAAVTVATTTAPPVDIASNATGDGAAPVVSKINSTTLVPAFSNATNTHTTVAVPLPQKNESNGTSASTIPPAPVPVNPTQKSTEETTKATDKPKEETTKYVIMPKEDTTKPSAKPEQEATKGTEKPASQTTVVTKKPEENLPEQVAAKTTEKPEDVAKPEQHSDSENEIGHGGDALHLPEALSQENSERSHAESAAKSAFLQPTESAAILAGVFVAIALLGYAGLLLWRRVLEKRYGNREMLVNEDDDFDTSDMRHFEL